MRDLMWVLSSVAVTAACAGLQENATPEQAAETETVYTNGRIHTQDLDLPWAESLVTRGDRIVLVGSDEDALRYAGPDARFVDMQGRFVMPGIIDAHTHPGLISVWGDLSGLDETVGENEEPAAPDRMPVQAAGGDAGLVAAVRRRSPVHSHDHTGVVGRRRLPA